MRADRVRVMVRAVVRIQQQLEEPAGEYLGEEVTGGKGATVTMGEPAARQARGKTPTWVLGEGEAVMLPAEPTGEMAEEL
jgi:hypothetical protein